MTRQKRPYATVGAAAFLIAWLAASPSHALTLKEAIDTALHSNPEIGQAIENREAIEFELRQARGLYLPTVDLEASAGVRLLDNVSRRALDLDDDELEPSEFGVVISQKLLDFGKRRAELDRQASRVDGASLRVLERSQVIALAVVQDYLEYLLQARIVADTAQNVQFHRDMLAEIRQGVEGGALTEADQQQADERLQAARARNIEATGELEEARIRFFKTVGVPLVKPSLPRSVAGSLPGSLDSAIGLARQNSPRVKAALSDIDTAAADVRAARSNYGPELFAEGRARSGWDVDGDEGQTNDLQARLVLKWNLYRGGIDKANEQEQIRRESEQRLVLHQVHREIEEVVRTSWDRRFRRAELAKILKAQAATNDALVSSYREQFKVGRRSLLDVLDAQNTRFNTKILADTASYASLFAEYRILATTGDLLTVMGLSAPKQSDAYARTEFNASSAPEADDYARTPSRQENNGPLDLLAPIRKKE